MSLPLQSSCKWTTTTYYRGQWPCHAIGHVGPKAHSRECQGNKSSTNECCRPKSVKEAAKLKKDRPDGRWSWKLGSWFGMCHGVMELRKETKEDVKKGRTLMTSMAREIGSMHTVVDVLICLVFGCFAPPTPIHHI